MSCVFILGSNFFGTLWASWTCTSISLNRLGKFSFIICLSKFSICWTSSCPSGTPVIWVLECLKLSQRFLSLSSFSGIFVSSFCFGWMVISSFCSKLLIWVLVSFPSLLSSSIFLYFTLHSLHFFILGPNSIISVNFLITSVFNSASHRLSLSSSLSSFSGVLIYSFIWAIVVCLGAPVTL